MNSNDSMLTPEEAAKYLNIGIATLYRRMKEKGMKPANYNPMLRRQKEARYTKAQLDELKESYIADAAAA